MSAMSKDQINASLFDRVKELETEADALRRERDAALAEVDRITEAGRAHIRRAAAFEAQRDELLVALHGIGKALGIPDGERSPYSVTCGTLECVNRLAEIEAQEPAAIVRVHTTGGNAGLRWTAHEHPGNPFCLRDGDLLYARPAPAASQELADPVQGPMRLTDEQIVRLRQTTRPLPGRWGDTKAFARAIECASMMANGMLAGDAQSQAAAPERADPEQSEQDDCSECGGSGWHKLSCSQRADGALRLPATRDAGGVVTVCQRPKLRAGDMRRTKSHGLQIRVQCMARDFDGRPIGRLVRAGRPVYGWRKPEELDEWDLHLLQRPDIAAEVAKEKTA